ncbi:MAG: phenylalanine--tRNA ligase subunit beta [Thermoprotei archaeon]|nr:MAG: phenylalanine--tRNA ligase subunit beta [Thermoprotei archaeon]
MIDVPVIDVARWDLERLVGRMLEDEEVKKYLPMLKCEIEELSDTIISYEATHDRPDLFSAEGLARALKGLLEIEVGIRKYRVGEDRVKLYATGPSYRPYIVGAIVKGLDLDDESIKQLMNLQEKLHITYCRNRRKASIGLYDLDKITPPFRYIHVDPDSVRFTPLEETREMSLREILEKTEKGRLYAHLIKNYKTYPLLVDSNDVVLSMPPIINSEDTKVTEDTRRVFIDVTGIDLDSIIDILNIITTSTAERGKEAVINLVEVQYGETTVVVPKLDLSKMVFDSSILENLIGIKLEADEIISLLRKMRFDADISGDKINVWIPPYRVDILHPVDVAEDIAMAYGYENIGYEVLPPTGAGKISPIERFSKKIRDLMIGLQFQEVANYMMNNPKTLVEAMRLENVKVVEVENPKMEKYTALRNWLLPELLEVLSYNKHLGYPLRIFEIGDVAIVDEREDVSVRIERHLCAVVQSEDTTLTDIMVYAKALFESFGLKYEVVEVTHPSFIEGRSGKLIVHREEIGLIGEVHPEVITAFGLEAPVAAMEVNLNSFLRMLLG